MRKKPIHLKDIDPREDTFFYFKLDATTHVLYDSDMGEPVAYGSFNMVGNVIVRLPKTCTIYYMEPDASRGWKMKKAYKPDGLSATDDDKKKRMEKDDDGQA